MTSLCAWSLPGNPSAAKYLQINEGIEIWSALQAWTLCYILVHIFFIITSTLGGTRSGKLGPKRWGDYAESIYDIDTDMIKEQREYMKTTKDEGNKWMDFRFAYWKIKTLYHHRGLWLKNNFTSIPKDGMDYCCLFCYLLESFEGFPDKFNSTFLFYVDPFPKICVNILTMPTLTLFIDPFEYHEWFMNYPIIQLTTSMLAMQTTTLNYTSYTFNLKSGGESWC